MFPILNKKRQNLAHKKLQKCLWDWVLPRKRGIFPPAKPCLSDPRPPNQPAGAEPRVRALPQAIQRRGVGHRLPRALARGLDKRSRRGSRARGRGGTTPPMAPPISPPLRPYSEGLPRALPAFCSAAAGASVCADLEGGDRSSSFPELGIPSALQPLARQSLSPSRGPGAAPVSYRECAGARGKRWGAGVQAESSCAQLEAALQRPASERPGTGCSLRPSSSGLHSELPPFLSCWSSVPLADSQSRSARSTEARRVVELGIGPDTGTPLVSTVTLVLGDPQYLSPGGQPASTPWTRNGPPKSPFTPLGFLFKFGTRLGSLEVFPHPALDLVCQVKCPTLRGGGLYWCFKLNLSAWVVLCLLIPFPEAFRWWVPIVYSTFCCHMYAVCGVRYSCRYFKEKCSTEVETVLSKWKLHTCQK